MADVTGWSGQQIIDFLLKYPTPSKAGSAGADNVDTYYHAACTDTGMWFLPIHAQNRLNAGDRMEYDEIMAVVKKCQSVASILPVEPPPAPEPVYTVPQVTLPVATGFTPLPSPTGGLPSIVTPPILPTVDPITGVMYPTPAAAPLPTVGGYDIGTILLYGGIALLALRLLRR